MKKISIVMICAFCLVIVPAMSQKQLYFGAGFSGLSMWMTNQNNYGLPEMDYKSTFGMAGNASIGYDFTKNIGLKIEIGYSKLGQDHKDTKNDILYERKIKLFLSPGTAVV